MRKKLLAGILALALCSTNMPLQTIFAEEFTSGNQDVVSEEETPEIFTNEEQEAAGDTHELYELWRISGGQRSGLLPEMWM